MVANDAATDVVGESAGEFARSDQPDAAEVNRLVRDHLDLVEIIASQISRSIDNCIDFDELLAAGREGLFEAARRLDPKRGASFRTFANTRRTSSVPPAALRSVTKRLVAPTDVAGFPMVNDHLDGPLSVRGRPVRE